MDELHAKTNFKIKPCRINTRCTFRMNKIIPGLKDILKTMPIKWDVRNR